MGLAGAYNICRLLVINWREYGVKSNSINSNNNFHNGPNMIFAVFFPIQVLEGLAESYYPIVRSWRATRLIAACTHQT